MPATIKPVSGGAPLSPQSKLSKTQKQTAKKNADKEKVKELEEECERLRKIVDHQDEQYRRDQGTIFDEITTTNEEKVTNAKLQKVMETQEETIERLKAKISSLEDDVESEKSAREDADKSWAEINIELEAAKKKIRETEEKLTKAETLNDEKEETIDAQSKQIKAADEKADEDKAAIASLGVKLKKANENVEAEKEKTKAQTDVANGYSRDNAGISKQLSEEQEKCAKLTKERDELQEKEATREQTEANLKEARDKLAALEDQITKLKIDYERKPFDDKPTAYATPNPVAGEPKATKLSLEDELAGVGGSSDDASEGTSEKAHSEEGSDDEEARRSPSPEPAGEDDTLKIGESGPYKEPPVQISTVIKTETKTETIYVPFEVSDHSPLLCWIQTELNFLILFSIWVTIFLGRASSFLHQRFGIRFPRRSVPPPSDDFDIPAPDDLNVPRDSQRPHDVDVTGDTETPIGPGIVQSEREKLIHKASQSIPPVEHQPDNREVFGDPVSPLDDAFPTMPTMPTMLTQVAGGPAAADPSSGDSPSRAEIDFAVASGNGQSRPWYQKIISPLPDDVPSVAKTLWGMLFHLLLYASIGWGIAAYYERQLWLNANDHSRIFLLQLLHNPHGYQSFLYRIASPWLSESWRHSLDVFIFKYFVEMLGLQAAYALPG
jgi:hypothetical protein